MPLIWYYPRNFALVNGLSLTGGAVGMMTMPPITDILKNHYGLHGAMIVIAAVSSHCVLAGTIIRTPKRLLSTCSQSHSWSDSIVNALDIRPFAAYENFVELLVIFLTSGAGLGAWTLFLVPSSIMKGISSLNAAYLSTIGGIGHLIGRLIQGPLVDYNLVKDSNLFGLMSAICSVAFLLNIWLRVYYAMGISAFLVGFATGMQYALCLNITKTLITHDDMVLAGMGWTHLAVGIGKVAAGPVVGKSLILQ